MMVTQRHQRRNEVFWIWVWIYLLILYLLRIVFYRTRTRTTWVTTVDQIDWSVQLNLLMKKHNNLQIMSIDPIRPSLALAWRRC